jgi:hypothetical protein
LRGGCTFPRSFVCKQAKRGVIPPTRLPTEVGAKWGGGVTFSPHITSAHDEQHDSAVRADSSRSTGPEESGLTPNEELAVMLARLVSADHIKVEPDPVMSRRLAVSL